jgi:hypothetical protein
MKERRVFAGPPNRDFMIFMRENKFLGYERQPFNQTAIKRWTWLDIALLKSRLAIKAPVRALSRVLGG